MALVGRASDPSESETPPPPPPRENLKLLADKGSVGRTYAEEVVSGVSEVWERLKEAGLT